LINYFKNYSSLGDDRFFVSPCTFMTLIRCPPNAFKMLQEAFHHASFPF